MTEIFANKAEAEDWAARLEQPGLGQEDLRRALIARIWLSDWQGPEVLRQCQTAPLHELRAFTAALDSGGAIPLRFRWASDDENGDGFRPAS